MKNQDLDELHIRETEAAILSGTGAIVKTENTTTVTLSDGTHAANYVFDADLNQLLDYKFTESSTKGRSISID